MQLFIQALFVITYLAGTFCQKITFDNTDVGGTTVGRFYIDGTIGENVTEILQQKWRRFIFIEAMKINASAFSTMCSFDVLGAGCVPDPVDICQCVYNKATDNIHFVVNGTADPDLYNAIIWARWQHQNLTNVYSNKNYTVPGHKDWQEFSNGASFTGAWSGETFSGLDVASTTVEPTTGDTETTAVEDTTTSASITSPATVHDVTTTTTESTSSSSNITDETTTTESTSSSSNITEPTKPAPGDNIPLIVCLSVILPLVAIAVVIGIVWYCKKKKERSQAVSNNGTGSTAKVEKHEQPKQQSEHTNQAYEEERRISPTSVTLDEAKSNTNDNLPQHNSLNVNNSHVKDNTNGGSASQTVPGEPRQLPPLRQGQPRPPSVETTSHKL